MEIDFIVQDHTACLTIDRSHVLNLLTPDLMRELEAPRGRINDDPSIRAGILTGHGTKAFCAGTDIQQ